MSLKIAAKLNPFSHQPGVMLPIPLTPFILQAYPTRLIITHLERGDRVEEKLDWTGEVEGFTVQLDLDRSQIAIFGHTALGFKRVWIQGVGQQIQLKFDKGITKTVASFDEPVALRQLETLSLGAHIKLNWDKMAFSKHLEAILPLFFSLAQQMPLKEGSGSVLDLLNFPSAHEAPLQLRRFLQAGFKGMLVPRLQDDDYQGIIEEKHPSGSALTLFGQGYQAVRKLFFKEKQDAWNILPDLPSQFHAGRLLHLRSDQQDEIEIEWSKKQLKRVVIHPVSSKEVNIQFPHELSSFRYNRSKRCSCITPVVLEAKKIVVLDRFEKS
ncbi:MAG: hypothetical protein QRY72_03185 [Candidatus Rhabdochlamydia sp.]